VTLTDRLVRANWLLLGLAVLLTAVGIATVGTASEPDGTPWAWLQLRWAIVAVAFTLLLLAVPYDRFVAASPVLYAAGIAGLLAVLAIGSGRGAQRWIDLGAFRMQPSEFMKPILVVTLAGYVRYRQAYKRFRGLAWPFAMTLLPVALVMKQPDLGTALLLVPVLFASLFVAGARPRHLALVALAGMAAGVLLYVVPGLMEPYQKDRVRQFLLQDSGTEAARVLRLSHGHQLDQSKTAVALGGLLGADGEDALEEAIGRLPERQTDFVFAVLAAKWGLLGVSFVLLAYLAFLATLLSTAAKVKEPSGRILAVGVFTLFAVQVLVNLGMTLGLLPVVGVTLPFFSYGGSSLLTSFAAVGLVLAVELHPKMEFGVGDFD
jgi:rod shape determining protein RodA